MLDELSLFLQPSWQIPDRGQYTVRSDALKQGRIGAVLTRADEDGTQASLLRALDIVLQVIADHNCLWRRDAQRKQRLRKKRLIGFAEYGSALYLMSLFRPFCDSI